ncbi:MAG: cytochrome c oxidase accessory protein CcoG [Ignavibacteriae bacterium]|nr:cytochrome c oxidase accessory protein CcoG [Ignavibacteriota bacterium]
MSEKANNEEVDYNYLYDDGDRLITRTGDSFRDRVSTIDRKGHRVWVYPHKPKGIFHRFRILTSIILLVIMGGTPFIKLNGDPLILLNVIERKFIIFGMHFWMQDFFIFALSFIALVIFIVLFTAIFGRIWCGWACPQTIFMEMVFRKIEYLIEGDGPKQRKLDESPYTFIKIFKKTLKHTIFFALSWLIGNIFLSYIIGVDELFHIISEPVQQHTAGFIAMLVFTLVFYGIFARFREQACIYICPYGRLQSVLLDKNSIVVAYDFVRGEPRTKLRKDIDPTNAGDCIDCSLCVKVCPTGIDIRNGTQLECGNCTACIDACNSVMKKVKKPKNLIKYASINQIESNQKFRFTTRIALYSVLLIALIVLNAVLIGSKSDIGVTMFKAKGSEYIINDDESISNLYTLTLINKTSEKMYIDIIIKDIPAKVKLVGTDKIVLNPNQLMETAAIIEIPEDYIDDGKLEIKVGFYNNGKILNSLKTNFSAPKEKEKKEKHENHK